MAIKESWPNEISVTQLSLLTGKDRQTIRRRLEGVEPLVKKKTLIKYDIRTALVYIFEPQSEDNEEGPLNHVLEKAKLDRVRRQSLELDMEIRKGNVIERDELKESLSKVFGAVRAKLLNLPLRIAQRVSEKPTKKEIEVEARKLVRESLDEISENKILS